MNHHAVCMRFGVRVLTLYILNFVNCDILGYTKINHKYHKTYMVYPSRELYIIYREIYIKFFKTAIY